ncbi:MAG: cysteine desulfurase family protein [Candidatus Bilamarchaeaceae archaeon]
MDVYLDNAATTMVDPRVLEEMLPYLSDRYGNPSSVHQLGRVAREAVETARERIAKSIKARADEIVFTSGGTEANNLALKGIAFANKERGNHIITTAVEHKCVLNSCKWLETQGFRITYLSVDGEGFVNAEELENAITDKTILFSVIHGNNEIGTIQNLEELGKICRAHGIYFHTDACQSYTKAEIDVRRQNLHLVTLNAHKIHGPKGVGALYIREGTTIVPWQHGGGQEFKLRGGTENVPGIVGFAKAVEIASNKEYIAYMSKLRDRLIEGVLEIEDSRLNGPKGERRLCNNANFSFRRIEGEALGALLGEDGIKTSTGSACASHTLEKSHVLKALGITDEEINGSVRMTISRFTKEEEVEYAIEKTKKAVKDLRRFSPFKRVVESVLGKSH